MLPRKRRASWPNSKDDSISAEYTIGMNYIDTLLDLPWTKLTSDNLDIARAESVFYYIITAWKRSKTEFSISLLPKP